MPFLQSMPKNYLQHYTLNSILSSKVDTGIIISLMLIDNNNWLIITI